MSMPEPYVELLRRLTPLNRVHNGDEMTIAFEELRAFAERHLPGEVVIHEYQPGATYNHWIVPKRWKVRQFQVTGPNGEIIASKDSHPLALCPYSNSADVTLSRAELLEHVVSRSDLPHSHSFFFRRMYRHWEPGWNIAIPKDAADALPEGKYHVLIDVELTNEPMQVFEYIARGRAERSICLTGHLDHPGQVNDSLSGCIASLQIVEALQQRKQLEHTYRVLLLPEIIGSAIYLDTHEDIARSMLFAFCPNMTSHEAPLAFCNSKGQTSLLDMALSIALQTSQAEYVQGEFHKYPDCGDEISFDTVGYSIPTPTLSRVGELFRSYHSSDDDLTTFLQPDWQRRHQEFVQVVTAAFDLIERNRAVTPLFRGNPCLSNPDVDLYLSPSNINNAKVASGLIQTRDGKQVDLRNFMEFFLDALARGGVSLLEMSAASGLPFEFVESYARQFESKRLAALEPIERRDVLPVVSRTSLTRAGFV